MSALLIGYARCSTADPTFKQQYQDALDRHLGPEVNLVGPAADALREHRLDPEAVAWLQTNFLKTELELGHCLRTPGGRAAAHRPRPATVINNGNKLKRATGTCRAPLVRTRVNDPKPNVPL